MLISNATLFASTAYHYLIAGGGTAGLTLAARLSEDPSIRVGVLEAGLWRNGDPRVFTPGLFGKALGSEIDWNFQTTPQPELNGAVVPWNRGKMLGGSSGLNFMIFGRAGKSEYDNWGEMGNKGWNWKSILKYSKKSQTINKPTLPEQLSLLPVPPYIEKYHGTHGPTQTSFVKWYMDASKAFLPSLENLGIPINPEPMSGSNVGGFVIINTIDPANTTRSYSATNYLLPNIGRKNLVVLTGALVSKVVIEDKVATGLEFLVDGVKYTTKATKEVILSAGAIQSPHILELSGVGGRDVLQKAGVECKVDNPNVGENLQEHHLVSLTYEFIPGMITADLLSNATFLAQAQAEYDQHRSGILSSNNALYAILPLSTTMSPSEVTSILALATNLTNSSPKSARDQLLDNTLLAQLNSTAIGQTEILWGPRVFSATAPTQAGKTYLTLAAAGMLPWSRGSIHIVSSDPTIPPAIDPRVYSSQIDKEIMLASVRFTDKIAKTQPLAGYLVRRVEPAEGELSDEQWWAQIKNLTQTVKHPMGTCAMLPKEKGGVVDERLRVYGVKGLRVVDASVFPLHIAAHLQATVYAVAEKAADLILDKDRDDDDDDGNGDDE